MDFLRVVKQANWLPPYRLEYDGKYVTLFGKDKNHPTQNYYGATDFEADYEEMCLMPVVIEVRNAQPVLVGYDNDCVVINLRVTIYLFNPIILVNVKFYNSFGLFR